MKPECFSKINGFLVVLCFFVFFQSMLVSGFISIVPSTIERRYGFSSTNFGSILSTYSIGKLIATVPLSYIAGSGNIPRWLGYQCLLTAVGAFLWVMPQLEGGSYTASSSNELCQPNALTPCLNNQENGIAGVFYLFLLAQLCLAVGGATLYAIGPAYISRNSPKEKVPRFLGVFYAMSAVGPMVGYLLGAQFLKAYVEVGEVPAGIDSSDRQWVGRWWACFLFSSFCLLAIAPFFFFFPKVMPDAPQQSEGEKEEEANKNFRHFLRSVKVIFCNKIWVVQSVAIAMEAFAVSGYTGFGAKYMESMFGLSASTAATAAGGGVVPAAALGMFMGGWWVGKRHTRLSQTAWFAFCMSATAIVFVLIAGLLQCDGVRMPGLNVDYNGVAYPEGSKTYPILPSSLSAGNTSCLFDCNCAGTYTPVCSQSSQLTFFSPCHAGCQRQPTDVDGAFDSCRCVPGFNASAAAASSVTAGTCDVSCSLFPLFMILFFFFFLFTFLNNTPSIIIVMRCLPPEVSSVSLALNDVVYKLLGSIPGPIAFGAALDQACMITNIDPDSCGAGSCAVYENKTLGALFFLLLGCLFKGLSTASNLIAFFWIRAKEAHETSISKVSECNATLQDHLELAQDSQEEQRD